MAVSSGRGGTEQIILDLAERFVADGSRVTLVVPTGSASLDGMHDTALGQERVRAHFTTDVVSAR